ncbi:RdgB/HAM1 family non-canonical purine NTP pyrophosphatase [Fluviicola sp.]|jgi:XTP/dITP diphosphohydrolase|uniref:RdgB/HAM1 family non-canonical purine NTP pyrophosphatase n=1 Tax=Fluviicola sp. TaxID=1917219 RepID=UPI00283A411E|nr:RdgB/HAM1 family non-canonical purine NTP pyrophosphatase [Fluviicola sp.]MDR0801747.1 RdgB/HAM1 family non-canonical purine NTP pyrophosphatase [Fluviicola sp.]
MKLLFASSNEHKIAEIKAILPPGFQLISLKEIQFHDEIPETSDTIEGNAIQKATFLADKMHIPCFADDTGLVIPSLSGEPGVYSARYAGTQRNPDDNMNLVLEKLKDQVNRNAYFTTVIALYINHKVHVFEGRIDGIIISEKRGNNGFGYDPIFVPEGSEKTFAEMDSDEKNKMSHRGRALAKMTAYLKLVTH